MVWVDLGLTGPAQSDQLFHFTGRNGSRSSAVRQEIHVMDARQRLSAILSEEKFLAFPPFGATAPCVCFSECSPEHLAYLIGIGRFEPWGVVLNRASILSIGGGAVAYVPDAVYRAFQLAGLAHWAVRTATDSTWLNEREWRLPTPAGEEDHWVEIHGLSALLIGDADWRPEPVATAWVDGSTGEQLPGPGGNPFAEAYTELPRLWRESAIWVWNPDSTSVTPYSPGELS